ncbi:MAG: chemotaxis-specific protein-glutamate methyltransferase CheB [Burkholderiales bacterium]|nr:MAG: chemotaxis-specific protein-glutamate methyltransferase CheB [Burkholderiales bacterium]
MIKALIVDDSALVRKLLGEIFARETDFAVEFARTGVEALEKLQSFAPDVITLDINMPVMDGLSCLDRIMVERPCPVVMLSSVTAAGADATLEALRLGAVDVIAKPTGAVSLEIPDMSQHLVDKVRAAASARLPSSLRLADRIRHRTAGGPKRPALKASPVQASIELQRLSGQGLVLIGTSTGGPPALEAVLTALPANFGWPVLVVQHMPATFTGALAKRLNGICALAVSEVTQVTRLEPGGIYLARGDADMIVSRRGRQLVAMPAPGLEGYLWKPSVDRLVRTALEQVEPTQLVGVLMTGMGSDGSQAMTELHAKGGRAIAEAEETAVVWGMPGELAKAGGADWILPVGEIGGALNKLVPLCP